MCFDVLCRCHVWVVLFMVDFLWLGAIRNNTTNTDTPSVPSHVRAQHFLNRFVRQNVAEIDEIKAKEYIWHTRVTPAERAVYLELKHHLEAMDMNIKGGFKTSVVKKQSLKSKQASKKEEESSSSSSSSSNNKAKEAEVLGNNVRRSCFVFFPRFPD